MLKICRAEDGEVFQVNVSVRDIERIGSLELFLYQEIGVDKEAILAYLSDGRRLRNDNIRELTGAHDQSIFVFNKYYLDLDLDEVLGDLRVEPPLQPPIEDIIGATPPFRPSQLATSCVRAAHPHREHITHTLSTLRYQHEALRIASSSLDLNVLAIADAFEGIAINARKELDKQVLLLEGLDADLDIVGRVRIHADFMSPAVRKAIEAGERSRTLGDYVSPAKMRQVAETCRRTHRDLQGRFEQAQEAMSRLNEGAEEVRTLLGDTSILDNAEASARLSQDIFNKITDAAAALESPASDSERLVQELRQLDGALREEVVFTTDAKNTYTERCIRALRRISHLNNDLVQLPQTLASLQASFRVKTSFSHIQRLHDMLYAYGATVIEIVRRKEFTRFFFQRAQTILEVMAKLSASERKRRQVYRGEIYGQLPFETKGLDDTVPTIDFSPTGSTDSLYTFERTDVDEFLQTLSDLEQLARASADPTAITTIRDTRLALEKIIHKMDSLESGFDRIAERSLLSASRLTSSRRRASEVDEQVYSEMAEQLRSAQQAKDEQESAFSDERRTLRAEIDRLKGALQDADATADRADRLERDLHQARAQVESEATARRVLEERHSEVVFDVGRQQQTIASALADATEQTRTAEALRQELTKMRQEYEDVKELEARHATKMSSLLEDQSSTLLNLEEARARGEDLQAQIRAARKESEDVRTALEQADRDKDRLLRTQASEHDRMIRDCIAEADGDRAVLEHQFSELKATLDDSERQLKDAWARNEMSAADAMGLREELQRVEHELREARHAEEVLREDLRAGRASQSDYEQRLEESNRLVAQILNVAIGFRDSHVKAMSSVQTMTAHPRLSGNQGDLSLSTPGIRPNINGHADEPSPIDPSDPSAALEQLRAFDHDHFQELITKTGSTIRKWQKQCKEYRERAKGKISFRNFSKGDLALFLPTRNSVSKPWAAFNVSFPHYFLNATGHLAEQLRTREWIVARITSITERVVDHRDPGSNPYGLGEGVKYYTLEVEDWTQPSPSAKRRASAKKTQGENESTSLTGESSTTLPSGPPQAEVEESFEATRPPTSHLFPARTRTLSAPIAGPSSLSRLLAQAPAESASGLETIPASRDKTPSPSPAPTPHQPPPSPTHTNTNTAPGNTSSVPSPLRPGSRASRASRMSVSSRFSGGRIPPYGSASSGSSGVVVKAAPTTALSGQPMSSSPMSMYDESNLSLNADSSVAPSPQGSPSDGMSNLLMYSNRRRTSSYHVPRTSPLSTMTTTDSMSTIASTTTVTARKTSGGVGTTASSTLANLANSWGMSFGRRKRNELSSLSDITATTAASASAETSRPHSVVDSTHGESSASELLKRL